MLTNRRGIRRPALFLIEDLKAVPDGGGLALHERPALQEPEGFTLPAVRRRFPARLSVRFGRERRGRASGGRREKRRMSAQGQNPRDRLAGRGESRRQNARVDLFHRQGARAARFPRLRGLQRPRGGRLQDPDLPVRRRARPERPFGEHPGPDREHRGGRRGGRDEPLQKGEVQIQGEEVVLLEAVLDIPDGLGDPEGGRG
ncbi:hypothetical protein, partial [uncultured Anaerotruncus sp.]|uniref:hypothetical protein n=1 Tax=uncultured Anaerotruncus sp. TaxID=905011 RepID=UPI002672945B